MQAVENVFDLRLSTSLCWKACNATFTDKQNMSIRFILIILIMNCVLFTKKDKQPVTLFSVISADQNITVTD